MLGSAKRHPHDLVLGNYSVHTAESALDRGEVNIERIGQELRRAGKIWSCRFADAHPTRSTRTLLPETTVDLPIVERVLRWPLRLSDSLKLNAWSR